MDQQQDKQAEADINQVETADVEPTDSYAEPKGVARHGHAGWRYVALVFFCFIASFLGSWVFLSSGLVSTEIINDRNTVISQEGEAVAEVAERVSPSVVSIVTEQARQGGFLQGSQSSAGTGMVISADGYVMTNKHVIGEGATVSVVMADGTVHEDVAVVGQDPLNDVAFLKIKGVSNLKPVEFGNSSDLTVGTKVIAIGNALGQYQTTVTTGIISGLSRPLTATDQASGGFEQLENLLQTDAAINPGNSGGPLLTLDGKVVGINTAIAQDAEGIGFAIPIDDTKGLIKSVLDSGEVARAYLGVRYLMVTPAVKEQYKLSVDSGAYIPKSEGQVSVIPNSPAAKAGLQAGDVITKINGQTISTRTPLASVVSHYAVGDTVTITYQRGSQTQTATVTLERFEN